MGFRALRFSCLRLVISDHHLFDFILEQFFSEQVEYTGNRCRKGVEKVKREKRKKKAKREKKKIKRLVKKRQKEVKM